MGCLHKHGYKTQQNPTKPVKTTFITSEETIKALKKTQGYTGSIEPYETQFYPHIPCETFETP